MAFKSSKLLLLAIVLFMLTACGGGDSTPAINPDVQRAAVEKISSYAEDSSNPEPIKEDYINAGVENISAVDIDELNTLVAASEATDVDSLDELNSLTLTLVDTTPPVISLKGEATILLLLGNNYSELGATALDNKDGNTNVSTSGSVNVSTLGTYTITYTATDSSGNRATATRTIKVVDDTTPPVITITTPTTIKEGSSFTATATASDTRDGDVTVSVTFGGDTVNASTPPGTYTITYRAQDRAGNVAESRQSLVVEALTITELFEKAASGEINDVTYIVVGDSTRYYEGTNDVLINSRNSDTGYYRDSLNENIIFKHSSMEGQRVDNWLDGNVTVQSGGDSFTLDDTLSQIRAGNPKHTIVEFSMGINDALNGRINSVKEDIETSIEVLKTTGVKILLVSPVPYYKHTPNSEQLNTIYEDLKDELNLPFVSGYAALLDGYPENTLDKLHPKKETSKQLAKDIFAHISNNDL